MTHWKKWTEKDDLRENERTPPYVSIRVKRLKDGAISGTIFLPVVTVKYYFEREHGGADLYEDEDAGRLGLKPEKTDCHFERRSTNQYSQFPWGQVLKTSKTI